jgi:hypothetical protein
MLAHTKNILLLSIGVFIGWGLFIFSDISYDDKMKEEFEQYYRIYMLSLPDKIAFAGEAVPMADSDVRERLDRELLTNVYWQSQTLLFIKRASRYLPVIEPILRQNQIPDDFKYLAIAESGLTHVVSPAGAAGFWQILDKTARSYGLEVNDEIDERYHIEKSTQAACLYFKEAYRQFGSWALVAASYNMGMDGLKKQLQQQGVSSYYDLYLNSETARYMLRILAIKCVMESPSKYGFNFSRNQLYLPYEKVIIRVNQPINDLAKFALDNGLNYKLIKTYNPWLRKNILTLKNADTYFLQVPKNALSAQAFQNKIINDTVSLTDTHFQGITPADSLR